MGRSQLNTVISHIRRVMGAQQCRDRTDNDLLQRFAAHREEAAFAALMHRHGPMVLSVCRRMSSNLEDADDAFQATFLVLVRKAGLIRKGGSVGSWLHGVAVRVAREARIRAEQRPTRERQAMNPLCPIDPSTQAAGQELRLMLDEVLDQLPAKYRTPLVLHYLEGKTKEETARQLGWTEGTVSGRLARARDLLRSRLARRGLTLSSGMMAALLSEQGASATVPTVLADATMKSATVFALGEVAHGATATASNALANAVLKGMFLSNLKHVVTIAIVLGVLAAGLGVAAQRTMTAKANRPQESGNEPRAEKLARLDPPRDPQPSGVRAERLFARMEDTLARAKTLECSFEIKLEGLSYEGNLFLAEGNRARLEITEATKERRMRSFLVSDGASMSYQDNGMAKPQVSKTPEDLNQDILTWLARPGVFVPQCPLPDVKADDAKDRFPVSGFKFGNPEKIGQRETQRLEYQLSVKGQNDPLSIAVWLDLKTGLPVKRTAGIAAGTLVTETYLKLNLDEMVNANKFDLPK